MLNRALEVEEIAARPPKPPTPPPPPPPATSVAYRAAHFKFRPKTEVDDPNAVLDEHVAKNIHTARLLSILRNHKHGATITLAAGEYRLGATGALRFEAPLLLDGSAGVTILSSQLFADCEVDCEGVCLQVRTCRCCSSGAVGASSGARADALSCRASALWAARA